MGFLIAGTLGWKLCPRDSSETGCKALELNHEGTKRSEGCPRVKCLMGAVRGQWRRYGVPWYPRGTEFQTGRDQMLRTMNN